MKDMMFFSHAGEDHGETVAETSGFIDAALHLSAPFALLLIGAVLALLFFLLGLLKIAPMNRLIFLLPVIMAFAVAYMPHNPLVSAAILSIGFGLVFFLTLFLLISPKE